ncbi:serine hydroxymethyltransferase, partial [Candidatus Woesearchaeota archaeon]
ALYSYGFKVLGEKKGFTESHQVVLDVKEFGGGAPVAELLEKANIITNKNMIPGDTPEMVKRPSGLRLGTQELTRWGMREGEMEQIAEFFKRIIIDGERPEKVRGEVKEFRQNYLKIHYTFEVPAEAFKGLKTLPLLQ